MLRAALRGLIPVLAFCALLVPWQAGAQTRIDINDANCGPDADPAGCPYIEPDKSKDAINDVTGTDGVSVRIGENGYVLGGQTAIHIEREGAEDVVVTNNGTVVQQGGRGAGIRLLKKATSSSGNITVTNAGTIETSGSEGIRAHHQANQGAVTIMSSGTITATGLLENSPAIWVRMENGLNAGKIDIDITGGALSSAAPNVATVTADHWGEGNVEISVAEDATLTSPRNVGILATLRRLDGAGVVDIDHAGRIEGESGIWARLRALRLTAAVVDTPPVVDIDMTGDIVTKVPVDRPDPGKLAERGGRTTGNALAAVPDIATKRLTGIEEGTGIEVWSIDPTEIAQGFSALDRTTMGVNRVDLLARYDTEGGTNAVLTAVRESVARYFGRLSDTPDRVKVDASAPENAEFKTETEYEALSEADKMEYAEFDFDHDAHLRAWLLDDANAESLRRYLFSESEADALAAALSMRMMATTGPLVRYHTGNIALDVGAAEEESGGFVDAEGHGIRALYGLPHDSNGEIKVTVHEGARVIADKAGIFVSGAGRDSTSRRLKHTIQVDGTVWSGDDAVIRLGIGDYADEETGFPFETGTVRIGATGRLNAGADAEGRRRPAIVGAAGTKVMYDAGDADTSKIVGDIDLSTRTGRSMVTLTGNFRVTGDIIFDANDLEDAAFPDTLTLDVAAGRSGFVFGDIENVDTLAVSGAGMASIRSATFSSSTLTIDESTLFVHGHLNLGGDGTVTVTNKGKIVFVGTDAQITAGASTVDLGTLDHDKDPNSPEVPVVYVAGSARVPDTGLGQLIVDRDGNTVVIADVVVQRYDDRVPEFKMDLTDPDPTDPCVVDPDSCVVVDPDDPDDPDDTGAGGAGGNKGFLAFGGSLALLFAMFDLFPAADLGMIAEARTQRAVPPGVQAFAETPGPKSADEPGIGHRIVALDGDAPMAVAGVAGRASGLEMSLTMQPGGGFYAGVSVAPQVSLSTETDSVSGAQYGTRFGWRSDDAFVAVGYSRADLGGNEAIRNISGLGMLAGLQDLRHDRMSLSGGARIDLGGVSALPSLSVFRGTLRQDGYTASSAVFRTQVPGVSQDYSGWKAGVSFAPRDPFEAGGLAWRPDLNLTTTQVASDSVGLGLVQKGPGFSFTTGARVARLPKSIHALGAGVSLGGRGNWRVRGGYIGMATDGEVEHAAVVRFGTKF